MAVIPRSSARHVRVPDFERSARANRKVAQGVQRRTTTRRSARHDTQGISINPGSLYLWVDLKWGYLHQLLKSQLLSSCSCRRSRPIRRHNEKCSACQKTQSGSKWVCISLSVRCAVSLSHAFLASVSFRILRPLGFLDDEARRLIK